MRGVWTRLNVAALVLAVITVVLPVVVGAQPSTLAVRHTGTINSSTSKVPLLTLGTTTGTVQVAGASWTGTIIVRGTNNGTNWETLSITPVGGGSDVTEITVNGAWRVSGAWGQISVEPSGGWGSGTADIALVFASGGAGGGGGGSTSTIQGEHANNSANTSDKVGVLPCIGTAAAPSTTEGRQVTLSCDNFGNLRVIVEANGMSVDRYPGTAAANQDSQQIKASAGVLYTASCFNTSTSIRYVKLYENAAPTSATAVKTSLWLSGADANKVGGGHFNFGPDGLAFATAMGSRYTTGKADGDTGAITSGDVECTFGYR